MYNTDDNDDDNNNKQILDIRLWRIMRYSTLVYQLNTGSTKVALVSAKAWLPRQRRTDGGRASAIGRVGGKSCGTDTWCGQTCRCWLHRRYHFWHSTTTTTPVMFKRQSLLAVGPGRPLCTPVVRVNGARCRCGTEGMQQRGQEKGFKTMRTLCAVSVVSTSVFSDMTFCSIQPFIRVQLRSP